MPVARICPNAASEYQAFVDEVNDALLKVSPSESTVLKRDFNAHIGTDTETWKGVIGRYGVPGLNENGRYLLQFCCNNALRIMNTFFQHRDVHKYTWYKPSMEQKSIIDFCIVSADLKNAPSADLKNVSADLKKVGRMPC